MTAYLTYHTSGLLALAVCLLAPKKYISKIVTSLIFYGFKINVNPSLRQISDGLFTYYMMEQMAVGGLMTVKEQELRNVLEFYYLRNKFSEKMMTEEEQSQANEMLEKISKETQKYQTFKRVENLL